MKINGVIVVEGKTDVAFLSSFIDAEFVITNGSEVSKETIEYLKKVSSLKDIYVLTDPDFPGEKIRKILDDNIPNLIHCFIQKERSTKHGKVGVAESTEEEILNSLKNAKTFNGECSGNVTMNDLVNLGLAGDNESYNKRKELCKNLHLGHCNAKTLLKRLNSCNISVSKIKESL